MQTHSSLPIVYITKEGRARIFFSTRDNKNKSFGASIELDLKDPKKILKIFPNPILKPGPCGSFDYCGTQPTSILKVNNKIFMYYTG